MAEFEYEYTCPKIDEARDDAKFAITSMIDDKLELVIHPDIYDAIINEVQESISEMAEYYRDISVDMRYAAEAQLYRKQCEIDELKQKVLLMESRISDLEDQIARPEYYRD